MDKRFINRRIFRISSSRNIPDGVIDMTYIPDNYDLWKQHEAERERELAKYPVCELCGEILDSVYYEINNKRMCESCMKELYEREVELDDEW